MKPKRVNKQDFATPGSEATVFEKTSRLDEGKAPSCVYVPVTVILVVENSSAQEVSLSGKGWKPRSQDGDGNEDRQGHGTAGGAGSRGGVELLWSTRLLGRTGS